MRLRYTNVVVPPGMYEALQRAGVWSSQLQVIRAALCAYLKRAGWYEGPEAETQEAVASMLEHRWPVNSKGDRQEFANQEEAVLKRRHFRRWDAPRRRVLIELPEEVWSCLKGFNKQHFAPWEIVVAAVVDYLRPFGRLPDPDGRFARLEHMVKQTLLGMSDPRLRILAEDERKMQARLRPGYKVKNTNDKFESGFMTEKELEEYYAEQREVDRALKRQTRDIPG